MGHTLQTLPQQIMNQIVGFCYQTQLTSFHPKFYKVYRQFREYSHLCRNMRKAALPYLRRRLIFERYNLTVETFDRAGLTHEELRAAKKLPAEIRWLSNLRAIVEDQALDAVTEVVISTVDRYPDPDDVVAMLQQFGVDRHAWPNVRLLCVNNRSDYEIDDREADDGAPDWIPEDSFTALSSLLLTCFPNVDDLWMDDNRCRRVGPRNAMSSYIMEHLSKLTRMHLRFSYMPTFGVKVLPAHITHLSLKVHSAYDYIDIPRVVAPTLVTLTLSAIPLSYLWDRFCNLPSNAQAPAARTVEFSRLERLDLTFHVPYRSVPSGKATEDDYSWEQFAERDDADASSTASQRSRPRTKTVSVKDRAPKYSLLRTDTKRPRFPKLQHLLLNLYPGRVQDFLQDIPAEQLLTLRISGDLVAFKGIRLKAFSAVQDCSLTYFAGAKRREWPHGRRFLAKALAQTAHVRSLCLTVGTEHRMLLPPPERIQCTGLRKLRLTAHVSYADLPALLRRLPCLEFLELQRTVLVRPPAQARTPEGLACHLLATGMEPVSTSLIKFVPDVLCRDATDETMFYNIFMLIARVPSLRELKMYSFYSAQFFRELLPLFKIHQIFPHIRHLATLDCSE